MKTVWVLTLVLHCALSEKFKVVGPGPSFFAAAGSDVVLPCSVRRPAGQSSLSAVDMNITWTRSDLGDALVHFYENHRDVNTRQIPHYRGRTAVFTEELQNGNVSLRLTDVKLPDEGGYKCRVESRSWEGEVSFNLRVEAIGERPVISVEKYDSNSEQFSLLCESKGWRPQPDLQLLNSKGENQTAGDPEIQRHADLFNVKRRFTVHKNHIDTFYCRATLGEHKEEKEIRPIVFYDLLPMSTGAKVGIGFAVIWGLLAAIVTVIVFYKYKEREEKEELKRAILAVEKPEEEQRNDSSVEMGLLKPEEEQRNDSSVEMGLPKPEEEQRNDSSVEMGLLKPEEEQRNDSSVEMGLLKPEEEQRNDSSVTTALLKDLRKVPLQELREKLRRLLESRSGVLLRGLSLTENSCAVLASALSSASSHLTELNLSYNYLQDSGVKKLFEGLKSQHCKLKKLRLINCSITDAGCLALYDALKSNPSQLNELNLSLNVLGDSGVEKLCDLLKKDHCQLKKLLLIKCHLTKDGCAHLASALSKNSKLEVLDLSKNNLQDEGVKELCREKNELEILRLERCGITDAGCAALTEALEKNTFDLKKLNLINNKITEAPMKKLSEVLKNKNCKLETRRWDQDPYESDEENIYADDGEFAESEVEMVCVLTEESWAVLASVLMVKNSPLRKLNLSRNELQDSGVKELCDRLRSENCKLETLILSRCRLTEESCADLASVLIVENSPLRELDLSFNDLHDSGVKKLCDGLRSENCKLETLKLSGCLLTEESCADLASALMVENSPLRELDLSYNELQDSGVKKLCDGLRSENCKLETLRLSSCSITDEGCAELVTALKSNPSYLTELHLTMNQLGASGVEQLNKLKNNPGYKLEKLRI